MKVAPISLFLVATAVALPGIGALKAVADATAPATAPADAAGERCKLTLMPSGASTKLGSPPNPIKVTPTRPESLKKAPDLANPMFAEIPFGGRHFLVALDEPKDKDAACYVDTNGNGDLTDDPPVRWTKRMVKSLASTAEDPQQMAEYSGTILLPLRLGDTDVPVSFAAVRIPGTELAGTKFQSVKSGIAVYRDYMLQGTIPIGDSNYLTFLDDFTSSGDFSFKQIKHPRCPSGIMLAIDLNNNGKIDGNERFDASQPFAVNGKAWELADYRADGSFRVAQSLRPIPEPPKMPVKPVAKMHAGMDALAFTASTLDGKAVDFPGDYKGRLVLLDFWATWCGPCMAEVPGLVKAYDSLHDKGLDVLGVSLDTPETKDRIPKVLSEKKMTWPQVYDGAKIIRDLYGAVSIPFPLLVDGDTGRILADSASLRGSNLIPTLEAALAKKAEETKK